MTVFSLIPFDRSGAALLVAAALAIPVAGSSGGQTPPQAQASSSADAQPQSREDVNLVRVDVYPSAGGAPVTDLTAADFEVLEDGVPQKIESFERVEIPRNTARTPAASSRPVRAPGGSAGKSRVFVLFLDSYFTDIAGSTRSRRAIVDFLDRLVGPEDLVGVMTLDMSPNDLALFHPSGSIESVLSKQWVWGHRDTYLDPIEDEYTGCYPQHASDRSGRELGVGIAEEMIERRREKAVLESLAGLVQHLRGVSDERKAVIAISDGWVLFRPNFELTDRGTTRPGRPGSARNGRAPADAGAETAGVSTERCDRDRVTLATADDKATYDELVDSANRANVTFYPISTDGLREFDKDLGPLATGDALPAERQAAGLDPQNPDLGQFRPATGEAAQRKRIDALRSLAVNTDGVAATGTDTLDATLGRIVSDLSSYYLIGYSSTNQTPDGKFRRIDVHVKRPGVDVRARRGYRAPSVADLEKTERSTHPTTKKSPVETVLAELKAERSNVPLRLGAACVPLGGASGSAARAHVWGFAELGPDVARQGEWIGGGTIEMTLSARDGSTLASGSVALAGGQRAALVDFGEVTAPAGEAVVHAAAHAAGGGRQNYAEAVHLESLFDAARPLIYRKGPGTAMKFVPTAVTEFNRTEHIRVDVPLRAAPASPGAELLDRFGKPIPVPVTVTMRTADGLAWLTADVALAPLAEGTYLVRVTPDGAHQETAVLAGFRLVP